MRCDRGCHCEPVTDVTGVAIPRIFREPSYHACHCEAASGRRGNPFPPWLPLWGSCHEVTERANKTLSAPLGHLSHRERQGPHPSRLRRATYTLLCNCHWQLLDFDSLRGAPPQGKALITSQNVRIPRFWKQNRGIFSLFFLYFFSAFRPASIRSRPSFRISKEVARQTRT